MQLSPLQSRLAMSFLATCLLLAIYLFLFPPQFALAAELDFRAPDPIILEGPEGVSDPDRRSEVDGMYEPEFAPFDRSIIGRAPPGVTSLVNNVPEPMNVNPGSTQCFVFEQSAMVGRRVVAETLELRDLEERGGDVVEAGDEAGFAKRQSAFQIYLSANTCMQPQSNSTSGLQAPQLTLYISTSSENTCPGPGQDSGSQIAIPFMEGAVIYNTTTTSDVYIGVAAPNVTSDLSGGYNVQVAASVDAFFFNYNDESNSDLVWVDSDASAALLMTSDLTTSYDPSVDQQVMSSEPYVMFAQPDGDASIDGVRYSYCGLQNYASIAATKNGQYTNMVSTSMTTIGPDNLPKQQFYLSGLEANTTYQGILAVDGNSTEAGNGVVGGGGLVFRATNFTTKAANANCRLLHNLTFCDQVNYAVPSNNNTFPDMEDLANFYDSLAQSQFVFFEYALAQQQCEADPVQLYSLVRNCSDCYNAYKAWLCSVIIPRCEDFSNDSPWLQPRAVFSSFPDNTTLPADVQAQYPNISAFNSSRNPLIDANVSSGPYKEVLPCQDVCYDLVQSCPAAMGFACPRPGYYGFNTSYGILTPADNDGQITCNYPGSAHYFSQSSRLLASSVLTCAIPGLLALMLL